VLIADILPQLWKFATKRTLLLF